MRNYLFTFAIVVFVVSSCRSTRTRTTVTDDGKISVTFVQVNDVYEIAPLQGSMVGGVSRIATLKKQELKKNANTLLVMAGDFLSPSVYNSLKYEGKSIRGRQMVAALNAAGLDFAVFGNHEFDIKETELQDRINESGFTWISSNTFHKKKGGDEPFTKVNSSGSTPFPRTYILDVKDADGTTAKIGFIGLTLPFNKPGYVSYSDPLVTATELYNSLKDSVDAVVAITHLEVAEDSVLASRLPGLALIMGGHEHDMQFRKVGNIFITKAHANAKSAYVNRMTIDLKNRTTQVVPELKMLDQTLPRDSVTEIVVDDWMAIADENFSSLGFDARKVVLTSGEPLEGRETEIRSRPTNLTRMIISALEATAPQADLAIFNSGSIRVDDIVQMPVTQYDIIRSLPYGGSIMEVDMTGSLLTQLLNTGRNNVGSGGFLQYSSFINYDEANNKWMIHNNEMDSSKTYRVAISDFLMSGQEANMDFLTPANPGIKKIYPVPDTTGDPHSDLRIALIRYLEQTSAKNTLQ